ncbi:hypothetical protein ACVWWO_002231 [Bradyrhizobium sp. F1.13.1]
MGSDQARPQSELEVKFKPVISCVIEPMARGLDPSLQVRNGLKIGGAHGCLLAGLQPVCLRFFEQSGLSEMVRERFGLSIHNFREPLLEGLRDRGMQRCASALQEP